MDELGRIGRRGVLGGLAAAPLALRPGRALAEDASGRGLAALRTWYRLTLELVRHTPTYSPPVASRAFAYLGIAAFEALADGDPALVSLAGQVGGMPALPPAAGARDPAVTLEAALAVAVAHLFGNTGPTGQRALASLTGKLAARASEGVDPAVVAASRAWGEAVARHVLDWAAGDGGETVENMGFPLTYTPGQDPAAWVPTSLIIQQQAPLLPAWGANRPFAMPSPDACGLPAPPAYSEAPGSAFHAEAMEVYETGRGLTAEQRAVARFWSDDPMLSPTPPGHWISIALQVLEAQGAGLATRVEVLARLGVAMADAFIACWHTKFEYDLLRPVTYIRRVIDKTWEPLLITPPFPEYPSGHSTQSGAAAAVLTAMLGEVAFEDATHADDGLPARSYPNFAAAAEEAALSRLYGGIHFRSAIARGLEQGACVGAHAVALRMRA